MRNRSNYSHRGCISCKKSSIKCDEASPVCVNCTRRGLHCEYKYNLFLYQPNQKTKRRKKNFKKVELENEASKHTAISPKPNQPSPTNSFEVIEESIDQLRADFQNRSTNPRQLLERDICCNEMNEICNENLFTVPFYVEHWKPYNKSRFLELEKKLNSKGENTYGLHPHENDPDVLEYLFHAFSESKAVYNFVLVIDDFKNCICEWILFFSKKYSIIAQTINSITSNLLDVRSVDDRWYCILQRNMTVTLSNISKRIGECRSFPEMSCYMICIMFLFSERSASRLDAWRLHLKGAFAILEKCEALYSQISLSLDKLDIEMRYAVHMYSFTKNWFVASETIACLSAPKGGAIKDIFRSKKCLSYDVNREGDGYLVGGFNLMKGYSQKLTPVFVDIIEYIMTYKATQGISLSGSEGILHSVSVSDQQYTFGSRILELVAKVETEKFDFFEIHDYSKRATMKACNICFCCAVRIFTYSVILGKSIYGHEVQYHVQTIEEQLATIHDIAGLGLCIHWPLFVAALCAPVGGQRKTFISTIQDISNNGTYVARNTVERLQKCWSIIDSGGVIEEEDYDCITM